MEHGCRKLSLDKFESNKSKLNIACVNELKLKDDISLPVKKITKTCPSEGNLIIDKKTDYLYYSDDKKWYLNQVVETPVNIKLENDNPGCYKNLDEIFNLFEKNPSSIGSINIKLEKGNHNLTKNHVALGVNKLNIVGDEREISSMSYVNGKRANISNRTSGPTGPNYFGKKDSKTEISFESPNIININVDELDLTKLKLVEGDKINICANVILDRENSIFTYTIKKIESNKLFVQETLSEEILKAYDNGSFSPSVTFLPNVSVTFLSTENFSKLNFDNKISIKGISFNYNKTIKRSGLSINFNSKTLINTTTTNKNINITGLNDMSIKNSSFCIGLSLFENGLYLNPLLMENVNNIKKLNTNGLCITGGSYTSTIKSCEVEIFNTTVVSAEAPGGDDGIFVFINSFGKVNNFDQNITPLYNNKKWNSLAFSSLFTFSSCNNIPNPGIVPFKIEKIFCENVKTICNLINYTRIVVFDVNYKVNVDVENQFQPINNFKLWDVKDHSILFLGGDIYDFKIPIQNNLIAFNSENFSLIDNDDQDYSQNPLLNTSYFCNYNSIIQGNLNKKWPGNVKEEKGGKVYFDSP